MKCLKCGFDLENDDFISVIGSPNKSVEQSITITEINDKSEEINDELEALLNSIYSSVEPYQKGIIYAIHSLNEETQSNDIGVFQVINDFCRCWRNNYSDIEGALCLLLDDLKMLSAHIEETRELYGDTHIETSQLEESYMTSLKKYNGIFDVLKKHADILKDPLDLLWERYVRRESSWGLSGHRILNLSHELNGLQLDIRRTEELITKLENALQK